MNIIQIDETWLDSFFVTLVLSNDIKTEKEYHQFKENICEKVNAFDFVQPESFPIDGKSICMKMKAPWSKINFSDYLELKWSELDANGEEISTPCSDTQKEWFVTHQEEVLVEFLEKLRDESNIISDFYIDLNH